MSGSARIRGLNVFGTRKAEMTYWLSRSNRRQLLKNAGLLLPALVFPVPAISAGAQPRRLSFYHTHTSEKLDVVYSENGIYLPDALEEINYLLRDFRSGEAHPIDPELLDILHEVAIRTASRGQFEIISGYRSPATNAKLRDQGRGVAKRSLHMQGKAIDVRLTDRPTGDLHKTALDLRRGGVGHYPKSNFIHVDTGRFRTW